MMNESMCAYAYKDTKSAADRIALRKPVSINCDHFYNVKSRNRFKKCVVCGFIKKDDCNV